MGGELSYVLSKMEMLTSDHASVVSMNIFVALLCACIVIGHLLEENRWVNESITALLIVSDHHFIININTINKLLFICMCVRACVNYNNIKD